MPRRSANTRRTILKKRSGTKERLIVYARRAGLLIGIVAGVFWLGSWVVLTGAGSRFIDWSKDSVVEASADSGFRVKNLYVEGRHYTDAQSLKAIMNIQKGDPIFSFDPDKAHDLIARLSWVKEVSVERRLPDTIYVAITERQPLALWQRNKRLSVIDEEGVVLTDKDVALFSELPVLVGEDVPKQAKTFMAMIEGEPDVRRRIESATLISGRRWDLHLKNGITVKLPENEIGLAISRLAAAQDDDALLEKDIVAIDLREEGRMTVQTKPGAVQDYYDQVAPAAGGAI